MDNIGAKFMEFTSRHHTHHSQLQVLKHMNIVLQCMYQLFE
jgi:hypothetical protein